MVEAGGKATRTETHRMLGTSRLNKDERVPIPPAESPKQPPSCPECGSQRVWKDGLRHVRGREEPDQRWLCGGCGYRFSMPKLSEGLERIHRQSLKTASAYSSNAKYCDEREGAPGTEQVLELARVETREKWAAGATADVNGYLINCEAKMILKGLKPETILGRLRALRLLMKRGANLLDPYSVFKAIDHAKKYDPAAKTLLDKEWSDGAKAIAAQAYKTFCKTAGIQIPEDVNLSKWSKFTQKIPWLPLEEEINALIVGSSKKVSAFLQLLKEVWCRAGEGWQLKWADVDQAHNLITINSPEKEGLPRQFKVSDRLIAMLNRLPKKSEKVFGDAKLQGFRRNFMQQRKRIAHKLQNPRILKITFHTLRHWGASMEYHRTKSTIHVKERLGHRSILSTEIYEHLLPFESDEYYVKRASTREEENSLIEAGFEFIRYDTTHDEAIYRKRK